MPRPFFLYVYILSCADGSYYTGVTNNPDVRLKSHNDGKNPKSYTYKRRPCQMVYLRRYRNFMDAIAREKQLKRWSHAKKKALIEGEIEELKRLAQCRNETHHRRLGFARLDGDETHHKDDPADGNTVPPTPGGVDGNVVSSTPDGVDG